MAGLLGTRSFNFERFNGERCAINRSKLNDQLRCSLVAKSFTFYRFASVGCTREEHAGIPKPSNTYQPSKQTCNADLGLITPPPPPAHFSGCRDCIGRWQGGRRFINRRGVHVSYCLGGPSQPSRPSFCKSAVPYHFLTIA